MIRKKITVVVVLLVVALSAAVASAPGASALLMRSDGSGEVRTYFGFAPEATQTIGTVTEPQGTGILGEAPPRTPACQPTQVWVRSVMGYRLSPAGTKTTVYNCKLQGGAKVPAYSRFNFSKANKPVAGYINTDGTDWVACYRYESNKMMFLTQVDGSYKWAWLPQSSITGTIDNIINNADFSFNVPLCDARVPSNLG